MSASRETSGWSCDATSYVCVDLLFDHAAALHAVLGRRTSADEERSMVAYCSWFCRF